MLDIQFDDLYIWWVINGSPNRDKIRGMRECLPASLSLFESLLPYFNSLKDKPLVKKENEASKEDQEEDAKTVDKRSLLVQDEGTRTIVVTSDWHLPFQDREALKVFFNFLYEYQPDELILNGNINDTSFPDRHKLRIYLNS